MSARVASLAVLALAALVTAPGCEDGAKDDTSSSSRASRVPPSQVAPPVSPEERVSPCAAGYRGYVISGAESWTDLIRELGSDRVRVALKVNRIDAAHVRQGDTLAVPDSGCTMAALAPFPPVLPILEKVPKLLLISRRVQAFGAWEAGRLVRWGPTSTGKAATPTPAGLYHTTWKAKRTVSTENDEWILYWYFNFDSARGLSLHQYDLPGYPASHACVRLAGDDAYWIYRWAEQWVLTADGSSAAARGTPVLVVGEYAYRARPPWKRLVADPRATDVTARELEAEITKVLPVMVESAR